MFACHGLVHIICYAGNSSFLDHPIDGANSEHLGSCPFEVSEEHVGVEKEHRASLLTICWLHWPSQVHPAHACSVLQLLNDKTFKCLLLVPSACGDITWDIFSETS